MHPKYWKPARIMAPLDSEGSAGGGNMADAFAEHFEASAPANGEPPAAAPVAESDEDAAARALAEEQAAAAAQDAAKPQDGQPDDPNAEPEKFTIKVDGKDVQLTADEVAEHYKAGLRQKDYTQKTMEVAEQRKAAEAEAAKARSEREQYATRLDHFAIATNAELTQLRAKLTPELLHSDPVEYLDTQRIVEERQAKLTMAQRELEQINGQRQQEREQSVQQFLQRQESILTDKLPDWKDPAKKQALMGKLEPFMREQGFTEQDGMTVLDARILLLANDAMKYRELVSRAKATQGTVAKAPPKVARTGTPANQPADARTTALRRFEQTKSRDDAAAVFAEMFG